MEDYQAEERIKQLNVCKINFIIVNSMLVGAMFTFFYILHDKQISTILFIAAMILGIRITAISDHIKSIEEHARGNKSEYTIGKESNERWRDWIINRSVLAIIFGR